MDSEYQSHGNMAIGVCNLEYIVTISVFMVPLLYSFPVLFKFSMAVIRPRILIIRYAMLQEHYLNRMAELEVHMICLENTANLCKELSSWIIYT